MDKWMKVAICMTTRQIFVSPDKYKKLHANTKYLDPKD